VPSPDPHPYPRCSGLRTKALIAASLGLLLAFAVSVAHAPPSATAGKRAAPGKVKKSATTPVPHEPVPAPEEPGPAPEEPTSPPDEGTSTEPEPTGPVPASWRRLASFESTLGGGTDGWSSSSPFSVTRTSEVGGTDGSYAAKIVTNGGSSGCSCPRMKFEDGFSYGPGDEVWLSGSWRIPQPTKVAWSRFMNLGHYEGAGGNNWYLGLESLNAGTFQVSYAPYGSPNVAVLPARPIPANRWFRVDLHFKLSPRDGAALTEWFIDGELVGRTTRANMRNADRLHFFNAGLPYFWPGNGNTTVYFDAPRITG